MGKKDGAETTASDQGYRTTTSYVASADTQRLIDDAAKNQDAHNPKNPVLDAKRLTGQQIADPIVNPENTALDAKRSTGRKFADHTVQPDDDTKAADAVEPLSKLMKEMPRFGDVTVQQKDTTDADALMQAYLDEFLRLDCPPECPLLTAALDCECIGNIAGAMAALKRHRGSTTGAICCYGTTVS